MLELNRYILALSVKLHMYSPLLCISPTLLPRCGLLNQLEMQKYSVFPSSYQKLPKCSGCIDCEEIGRHMSHQFSVPVYHSGAMFSHH